MSLASFKDEYEREQRGVSVRDVLKEALELSDEIDDVVITAHRKGSIQTSFSTSGAILMIGGLEVSKDALKEYLEDD